MWTIFQYILLILNIIATIVGIVMMYRQFKKVFFPKMWANEGYDYKLEKGEAQFFEPLTDKEKFDIAKNITDLTK